MKVKGRHNHHQGLHYKAIVNLQSRSGQRWRFFKAVMLYNEWMIWILYLTMREILTWSSTWFGYNRLVLVIDNRSDVISELLHGWASGLCCLLHHQSKGDLMIKRIERAGECRGKREQEERKGGGEGTCEEEGCRGKGMYREREWQEEDEEEIETLNQIT